MIRFYIAVLAGFIQLSIPLANWLIGLDQITFILATLLFGLAWIIYGLTILSAYDNTGGVWWIFAWIPVGGPILTLPQILWLKDGGKGAPPES